MTTINNDPWYKRTEFWYTVTSMILGLFANVSKNPNVQAIGTAMTGLAPLVYTWGRSNVKAAIAAQAMGAIGSAITQNTTVTPPAPQTPGAK